MTDATYENPHQPLGVGDIVGDTFSIFFRKLPAILLLGFIPALIPLVVVSLLPGLDISQPDASGAANFSGWTFFIAFSVTFLLGVAASSIVTAAIVQLAYDAKLNRPARLGPYFSTAIRNLPAIVILSIVSSVLFGLGFALLIVPGLWIYAVLSVFVPAIVIEGAGFRAFGRSAELTRGYRWSVVLAVILMFICVIVISLVVGFAIGAGLGMLLGSSGYVSMVAEAVANALGYGLVSVTLALIFARLKEIKEGVSVSDLVDVFK